MTNKNEWLGYSERGLLAAWFQDLCNRPNAPKVFQQLEGVNDASTDVRKAIRNADAITTVLEPSFAGFGDPDGIVVFRSGEKPLAALYIEAKRGPLATEWNDEMVKKNGEWKSSHLVVQIARRIAFIHAQSCDDGPIEFHRKQDYWKGKRGRKMRLEKQNVLRLIRELNLRGIPSVPVTLTSSAHLKGELSGDNALRNIQESWGWKQNMQGVIHMGFDTLLSHSAEFPLLRGTFDWNWPDTIVPTGWEEWSRRAQIDFGQSFERLREWAGENDHEWFDESGPTKSYMRLRCKRRVSARLRGCYGPGGPILDFQLRDGCELKNPPTGWRWWCREWNLQRTPMPANDTWNHNFVVPDARS